MDLPVFWNSKKTPNTINVPGGIGSLNGDIIVYIQRDDPDFIVFDARSFKYIFSIDLLKRHC